MEYLIEENERLREEIKNKSEWLTPLNNDELYEAKVQWEYWEARCRRYNDYLQQVIKITYDRIKPMLWNKLEEFDDFREHILSEVKEIKWDED
jgi:hypothetical protein